MRRDGQTDGGTDMTKLRVTFFLNFAKAPKNQWNKSDNTETTKSGPLHSNSDDGCRKFLRSTFVFSSAISQAWLSLLSLCKHYVGLCTLSDVGYVEHTLHCKLDSHFLIGQNEILLNVIKAMWAGQLSRYSDWLRAGWSGDRIPVGAKFSATVQTGPGAHPASCTMGTGSFPV